MDLLALYKTKTISRIIQKPLCKYHLSMRNSCSFCAKLLLKAENKYFREKLKQIFEEKKL